MPLWHVITGAETTYTLLFGVTAFFAKVSWPLRGIRSTHLESAAREDDDVDLLEFELMTLVLTEKQKTLYR